MSKHRIILVVLVAFLAGCGQGYIERTEQFSKRVKSVVNPNELQAWATNLIAKTPSGGQTGMVNVKAPDIPAGVLAIYKDDPPPDLYVSSGEGGPYVIICYGSGLGHWGLYVGDKSLKQESSEQIYVVTWQPGIYFWDGP